MFSLSELSEVHMAHWILYSCLLAFFSGLWVSVLGTSQTQAECSVGLGIWGTMVLCRSKSLKQWKHLFLLKYFCHHHIIILLDRTAVAPAGNLLLSTCIISVGPMTSLCSQISSHRYQHADCMMFTVLCTLLGRACYQRRNAPGPWVGRDPVLVSWDQLPIADTLHLQSTKDLDCEWLLLSFE